MDRIIRRVAAASALLAAASGGAAAAECDPGKPGDALTGEEAQAVYECLSDAMHEGYASGPKRWIPEEYVTDYRGWAEASRFPAAPGFHGGRFLTTWVNATGAAEYTRYAPERGPMPAGTLIAKESFSVTDAGAARPGPLFLMEKVAEGTSPETGDWYYMMVSPGGAPVAVNVVQACASCHQGNFGASDGLGYPVEDARLAD